MRIPYRTGPTILALASLLMLCLLPLNTCLAASTERASKASDSTQGNDYSGAGVISDDGRYVAFTSDADNLVAGDTNNSADVFVFDSQTGETTRVSVASDGTEGDDFSVYPSISEDGRYIAFYSYAENLVATDNNTMSDIFVHDRQTGKTTRVSVDSNGVQSDDDSGDAFISSGGRYVVFGSYATTLVAGVTNTYADIFVHDRGTGETTLASVASDGTHSNGESYLSSISRDGRYVAFSSEATNLVAGDTNGVEDVFVHDRQTGDTIRISVHTDGTQGDGLSEAPTISDDGRYVAFESDATNLVDDDYNGYGDIFVHDLETGETTRVSVASDGSQSAGDSDYPYLSADGRYVAFESHAYNLVDDDFNGLEDAFVHDRQTGKTFLVSLNSSGNQGNGDSEFVSVSSDGRYLAFESDATNLVAGGGDTNAIRDVFIRDRGTTATVSTSEVTMVTTVSASCGGDITDDGDNEVTARGVCWNTTGNPGTKHDCTDDGDGDGEFLSSITGLDPGTTYYVRAFATSLLGTVYGETRTFTTDGEGGGGSGCALGDKGGNAPVAWLILALGCVLVLLRRRLR